MDRAKLEVLKKVQIEDGAVYLAEVEQTKEGTTLVNAMSVGGYSANRMAIEYIKKSNIKDLKTIRLSAGSGYSVEELDVSEQAEMASVLVKFELAQTMKDGLLSNIAFDHFLGK